MEYRIFRLKEKVLEHLGFDWTVEQMAEESNISKEHLHKLFKKETGQTPIQFVKCLRLERAKALLETTNLLVKEVIAEVGIRDQTHFVRDFKKAYGFKPNEYRQKYWDDIQAKNANG